MHALSSTAAAPSASTRERIVAFADRLFYERGYEHTSFADIAQAVKLSRGNFYYHFKTKDDILAAVLAHRTAQTQAMLDTWSAQAPTPQARIGRFVHLMVRNGGQIRQHGCPVGTLCAELSQLQHPAQAQARALFTLFRNWLARQFADMGAGPEADALAMHLLSRSQGIATLAQAFDDEGFLHQEVALLLKWLHDTSVSIHAAKGG
jgi:AcrR family transcriptional regulator